MKSICRYGVLWSLFAIFVLSPCSSEASFLVELRNGRKLKVEGYQMEGKSCELYLESGSLRVFREEIKSIQEKKDDMAIRPKEEVEKVKTETAGNSGERSVSKDSVPQGAAIDSFIQRKAELRERLEEAKKACFAATVRAERDWIRQRMISVSRELFSLEAEVKGKHNGSLPDWWKEN